MSGTGPLTAVAFGSGLRQALRCQRRVDPLDDFVIVGRPEACGLHGHGRIDDPPAHAAALVFFLDAPLV